MGCPKLYLLTLIGKLWKFFPQIRQKSNLGGTTQTALWKFFPHKNHGYLPSIFEFWKFSGFESDGFVEIFSNQKIWLKKLQLQDSCIISHNKWLIAIRIWFCIVSHLSTDWSDQKKPKNWRKKWFWKFMWKKTAWVVPRGFRGNSLWRQIF